MQRKYKIRYNEWILISIGWIIVFYLYFIFSWWGIKSFLKDNWILEYMKSPDSFRNHYSGSGLWTIFQCY